jgi:hypothetical protein
MIHEEISTYEVCKLAKEKGFNERTRYYYETNCINPKAIEHCSGSDYFNKYPKAVSAPTQSLLQRWLREEKSVIIVLEYSDNTGNWRPFWSWIVYDKLGFTIEIGDNHDTYELALEDAMKYALEYLV